MSGLTCPGEADRPPQQVALERKMSEDFGVQATGRAVIYMRQHFHHDFINLRTPLPQLNPSQRVIMAGRHARLLRCWPAAGRLGLCLAIFPLDSWACGMAHACAVIKILSLSLCLSCGNPASFRSSVLVSKAKLILYMSRVELPRSSA